MQAELAAQSVNASRSGGLKGRLRRALSFNAAQTLKEEAEAEVEAEAAEKKEKEQRRADGEIVEDDDDDDVSIKASQVNGKLKAKSTTTKVKSEDDVASSPQTTIPPKKKGRAASLFNSRLNASTDNISLSSTVSSASVMIRKLGAMGKLARRNSLAGITSLFKDKDKNKDPSGEPSSKDKGKKKDKSAKGNAAQASVSLVTAELDRAGASGDWSVSAGEMNGLSPAAKLARQHTLKSNAEAAEARAREAKEREAAKEREEAEAREAARAVLANGVTQVPTWDRNTATRSPQKGGGMRINEDGTRTFVEDEDEDESEDGHYQRFQQQQHQQQQQGWDDDEDWDLDGDGDEDATIRVGIQPRSSGETGRSSNSGTDEEHEPWAVDVRRSVERTRQPARGILKRAESYDQQAYLHEHSAPTQRMRSNSYNSPSQSELGPLARIPSPDPDHIDGLHRHGSHSSAHGQSASIPTPVLPPLSFDPGSPLSTTFGSSVTSKDLPATPSSTSTTSIFTSSTSFTTVSASTPITTHTENRTSQIFQHPNFNSSAPALASSSFGSKPPTLTHRSATSPSKRLTFATNLSVYDTFSASVYDRRSEPATWSRLTPALAQRIKEELNSYKMEEMEVHAASRIQCVFFSFDFGFF